MRKIVLTLAAVAAFGLALPFAAPAQAQEGRIVIRTGDRDHARDHGRHWYRDRHEGRYHRDHDRKVFIIKRRHHDRD